MTKIISLEQAKELRAAARTDARLVGFTNGCFDLLHRGHVEYLMAARERVDLLFVALNADTSVAQLKGDGRPVTSAEDRAYLLASLHCVDYVIPFDDETPEALIEALFPDFLFKGGDWPVEEIVGREVVLKSGGEVISLETSVPDLSTSKLIARIAARVAAVPDTAVRSELGYTDSVSESLAEAARLHTRIALDLAGQITNAARRMAFAVQRGKKLLFCGNGGSASQAQHLAAEFVDPHKHERRGFPAIALTSDPHMLTALANDYSFDSVFSTQIRTLAAPGDVLVVLSTSGNSANVIKAVAEAHQTGMTSVGLLGGDGGELGKVVDFPLIIASSNTQRIQEAHLTIGHVMWQLVLRMASEGHAGRKKPRRVNHHQESLFKTE